MTNRAGWIGLITVTLVWAALPAAAAPPSPYRTAPMWVKNLSDSDQSFLDAYAHYKKGRYAKAAGLLDPLATDRTFWLRDYVLHLQARSQEKLGHLDLAVESYRALLDEYPDFPLARSHKAAMANAYYQAGRLKEADAAYHSLLDDAGTQKSFYLSRIFRIHLAAGPDEQALPIFLELYRQYPHTSEADSAHADVGRSKVLSSAFKKEWTLRDAITRVDVLVEQGQHGRARSEIAALKKKGGLDPAQRKYLDLKLAQVHVAEEKYDTAIDEFRKLLDVDYLRSEAEVGLGAAYVGSGRFERANDLLWEVLKRPGSGKVKTAAAETLVQSLKRHPDSSRQLAQLYLMLSDDPDVRDQSARFRWRGALETMMAGDLDKAKDLLLGIKSPGEDWWQAPAIIYWLGRIHQRLGDRDMSRYFFQEVQQHYPFSYYAYLIHRGDRGIVPITVSGPERPRFMQNRLREYATDTTCYANKSGATARYLERADRMIRLELDELARLELQGLLESKGDPSAIYLAYRELTGIKQYATVISDGRKRFSIPLRPASLPCDGVWPLLYPRGYRQFVTYMADKQAVDPNLLYGLIREESTFNPKIKSAANARGLMQIIPSTARIIQNQTGMTFMTTEDLYDPYFNVKLGVTHFKDLLDQYGGSAILALAAYNAGPGNVRRWMDERDYSDDVELAEFIPYTETHGYVKKVLSSFQVYSWLYKEEEPVVSYD